MKRKAAPSYTSNTQQSRQPYKPVAPSQDFQVPGASAQLPRFAAQLPGVSDGSTQDPTASNVIGLKIEKIDKSKPVRRFVVVYARASNRKHKRWEADGILTCQDKVLFLENVDNGRKTVASSYNNNRIEMQNLGSGVQLMVGGFEMEIQSEIFEANIEECAVMCTTSDLQKLICEKIQEMVTLDEDTYTDFLTRLYSHPAVLFLRLQQLQALEPDSIPVSRILDEYPDFFTSTTCYVNESGKLQALLKLVNMFDDENKHAVIVSSSTNSLDIIESIFNALSFEVYRLDSRTSSMKKVQIDRFNTIEIDDEQQSKVILMHIDTKTGGQSINGATKLILFDIGCWGQDIKSRIWKDTRVECQVYRLVTSNSFEEQEFQAMKKEEPIKVVDIGDPSESQDPDFSVNVPV